ncbi:MAG: undecaprenyl-diphosphatase UppP [Pirellulales bacterium]
MDLLQALILGIVQGLTEFLPISSTAHLRVVPALLGWPDPGAAFTAVVQIGTLAAVVAYFRADIVRIARGWLLGLVRGQPTATLDARLGWMMIVATVPIVVCGLLFKDAIEGMLRSLYVVAAAAIGLALVLTAAEGVVRLRQRAGRAPRQLENATWSDAVLTGLAQSLSLVPGASRSGVTITACLFEGFARDAAARFSFLLSLPAVFAAGVYQLIKDRETLLATQDDALALAVCTVSSGIVGYLSIAFLLRYLRTHSTLVFIVYRLAMGGLILLALWQGWLQP